MNGYQQRHIGLTDESVASMLSTLGYESVDEFMRAAIPESVRNEVTLNLESARSEAELAADLQAIANENEIRTPMIGLGYHRSHTPAVIRRNVIENPAWYTAYTPYQPEISQGRLEALLVFQTLVTDLTGLATANASLLDEPTAAAEAMALCHRVSKSKSEQFLVDADTHPHTLAVLRTRAEPLGIRIVLVDPTEQPGECFGALVSYPGSSGQLRELDKFISAIQAGGGLVAVASDLLALTLLKSPGEMGADICIGSAQRFGVPLGFGGPHAGFMSVRSGLERSLPGRLVGVSTDTQSRPAYRLALQTREQHIRREKATSNICTSQVLLAVVAAFYAAYHGPLGLREIATDVAGKSNALAQALQRIGISIQSDAFFGTVTGTHIGHAQQIVKAAGEVGIDIRGLDADSFVVALDETTTVAELNKLLSATSEAIAAPLASIDENEITPSCIPADLTRQSEFLTHPWFNQYRSETEMMRWLRRLADSDLALDRTMIPLGSCTMKLNAAAAMEPITWQGFADIHPFAPATTSQGYQQLIETLADWLAQVTGYAKVSLQPNAGSQGEFAGLLAIRNFHRANGEEARDVCLIPASAHGTNAASAAMAGMRVVVVKCDETGGVDLPDLRDQIEKHSSDLAAIMLTYPSTYGVYEDTIKEVCERVHAAGGQVYVDGANLNALVGWAKFGEIGSDVSHLNLHKTFCIPHGGGGPGVGPVAVAEHLVPFLPDEEADLSKLAESTTRISGAAFGSAGILPIPYAYIAMMGADGLQAATSAAVIAANYVATRLKDHFPVLYTGENGLVAHECILDIRGITADSGVTVDDIAKRLIDFGFHAPTMSFPISGTLMVEPTESESKTELDRFCNAMIAIKGEIDAIVAGEIAVEDSALRHAPHTAEQIAREWEHPYSREFAAYPVADLRQGKYWPPVSRIDGAYGDRNLMCTCPPVSDFISE